MEEDLGAGDMRRARRRLKIAFCFAGYAKWGLRLHLLLEACFLQANHCVGRILRLRRVLPTLLETVLLIKIHAYYDI
jgi:hypothetical protein